MTNKIGSGGIDNRPAQVGSDRAVKRTTSATTGAAASNPAVNAGDGVHITDSAKQLAALEQAVRALPDVNEAKVQEISQAITDGRYQVAPDRVADKLIRMEREFQQVSK